MKSKTILAFFSSTTLNTQMNGSHTHKPHHRLKVNFSDKNINNKLLLKQFTELVAEEQKTTTCSFGLFFSFVVVFDVWIVRFDSIRYLQLLSNIFHLMANSRFHKWSHELLFLYFHLILLFKND